MRRPNDTKPCILAPVIRGNVRPDENKAVLLLAICPFHPDVDVADGRAGRREKNFHLDVTSNIEAEQRQDG